MPTNGQLARSSLSPITVAMNGQQAFLRHDAAAAFNAMNAESVRRYGLALRASSPRAAYRPIADQWYFWNLWITGRGNLAARPGTSNHGWGLAIDLATPRMRQIVNEIGEKYGWAKRWSDAPSEWWHLRWREGHYQPDPTIRKGSTNRAAITRLQKLLRGLNMTKVVNGKYGIWTRRAVRRFQKKHGLPVDGVVGPATWAALRKASS